MLAVWATPRLRLPARALGLGVAVALLWALFAALAPTVLGIDHQGLLSIVGAGDHTALNLTLHDGARYPLRTLAPLAAVAALLALAAMGLMRNEPSAPRERRGTRAETDTTSQPALSA